MILFYFIVLQEPNFGNLAQHGFRWWIKLFQFLQ